MSTIPKPDREWRSMHMGRHGRPKISHRTWIGAWLHKQRHIRHLKVGTNRLDIYPCWFTDDNEFTERRHWHIGHRPAPGWLRTPGTTRARVKAVAESGYRVSVVLTDPELARLEELAAGQPLPEFTARAILGLARTGTRCCHLDPASCMLESSKNERRQA